MQYTPTQADWLRIVNSVCSLFGRDDTWGRNWRCQGRSDPAQRICAKHMDQFLDDYFCGDLGPAHAAPYFIVKRTDVPKALLPLLDKNSDNTLPGYVALGFRRSVDERVYEVTVGEVKARDILPYMEDWYSQVLAKNFACAGCCMTLIALAYISRSNQVRRPPAIVGCPKELDWSTIHGQKFHEIVQTIHASIHASLKLSYFMKQERLVPNECGAHAIRQWCRDCLFPEIRAKELEQEAKELEEGSKLWEQQQVAEAPQDRNKISEEQKQRLVLEREASLKEEAKQREQEVAAAKAIEAEYLNDIGIAPQHHDLATELLKAGIQVKPARRRARG